MMIDPDDVDALLVYADALQQQGDPRGELIMLMHRGQHAAADALLRRHRDHFYGSLATRPALLDATWHLGFFHSCRFSLDGDRGPGHEERALAALDALLTLPSARFLRELSIGVMNVRHNTLQPAIELLARHDLRSLRRLYLGDEIAHKNAVATDCFSTAIGATRPLYAAAPNLETLVLRSTELDVDLDGLALPHLSELRIDGLPTLDFLRSTLPNLTTLELIGTFALEDADYAPLLSGASLPALRHLKLGVYGRLLGRGGALFANAPLLRQLRTLDLSETQLDGNDVDAFIANAAAYAHLERLELGWVFAVIDDERAAALRAVCAHVELP